MKIKKLKIIEEGRICSPEELKKIQGGGNPCTYTGCNKYENCGWFSYESCIVASAAYGYENRNGSITCNQGYSYSTTGTTPCGASMAYHS